MVNRKRNEEIDILRGLAAICMILGHSILRYPIDLTGVSWCSALEHWIFTFHMELFFLLTGVCYKCFDYKSFVRKKFDRIVIPYLSFGIVTILFKAFGGGAVNRGESVGTGIYKLLLFGGNYWFLYVLFLIFLVYPLIKKVFNNESFKNTFLLLILLIVSQVVVIPDFLMLNSIVYYLPFFVVGQMCVSIFSKPEYRQICNEIYQKPLLYFLITMCIILYCTFNRVEGNTELKNFVRFMRSMTIIGALFLVTKEFNIVLEKSVVWEYTKKIICKCGQFSLQLYLFNGYILTVTRIILCNILKIDSPVTLVFLIWIINIVVTLFICEYILPMTKVIKKLCGI